MHVSRKALPSIISPTNGKYPRNIQWIWESDKEDQDYLKYCKPSLFSMHHPWPSLTRLLISDWSSTLIQLPILSLLTIPQAYPLSTFLNYTTVLYYTLILNFQCIYSHFIIQHLQSMIVLWARVLLSQTALFEWHSSPTVHEAQSQCLWWAFPIVFWSLANIFRKQSGYFIQNLNKFPLMVIVSNFE